MTRINLSVFAAMLMACGAEPGLDQDTELSASPQAHIGWPGGEVVVDASAVDRGTCQRLEQDVALVDLVDHDGYPVIDGVVEWQDGDGLWHDAPCADQSCSVFEVDFSVDDLERVAIRARAGDSRDVVGRYPGFSGTVTLDIGLDVDGCSVFEREFSLEVGPSGG